ncbi:hypothetical protein [Kutzneria kofuensis]|uniref:hypothetical protein n=1 Tax=Kutzneria kofuensis TaxID=103725 RepID=UPI0031EE83F2
MAEDVDRPRAPGDGASIPLVAPTTMPWFFGRYPHVDLETMRTRLELYGVSEQDFSLQWRLNEYRMLRDRQSAEKVSVAAVALVFGVAPLVVEAVVSNSLQEAVAAYLGEGPGSWVWWAVVGVLFAVLLGLNIHTRVRTPGTWYRMRGTERIARHRFFRAAGLAFATGYHVVVTQNVIGLAARGLFLSLQRRRWTWVSPPAVADRALRLTRPCSTSRWTSGRAAVERRCSASSTTS